MWRFSTSKKTNPLDVFYNEAYEKIFPEWENQIVVMWESIVQLLEHKISIEEAKKCYTQIKFRLYLTMSLWSDEEKDMDYFFNVIRECSNWKLDNNDIWCIMIYMMEHDAMLHMYASMIWILNEETDFDEIPTGEWDFWYSLDNPIPVKWISANQRYLGKLYTKDGYHITYNRLWSYKSELLGKTVDWYEIFGKDEKMITTLYVCPYYWKTSTKAPGWFILQNNKE
jgi:hypothetical protein